MKMKNEMTDIVRQILLDSEHERALAKLKQDTQPIYVPQHTVTMNIYDPLTEQSSLQQTILPDLYVYLHQKIRNDQIMRGSVSYIVKASGKPLPIAHVFYSSGSLCLGTIFVPQTFPAHQPLLPIETLLLHNDRYELHGSPKIPMTNVQIARIQETLKNANIEHDIDFEQPWVANDTLWRIGIVVLQQAEDPHALMHQIFELVFNGPYNDTEND